MTDDRTATLRVRTPEGVSFSFPLASPVSRLAAWTIDKLVITAGWSIISILLQIFGLFGTDVVAAVVTLGYFVVSTGYGIIFEWWWDGQTLGKRVVHLRVMDERGLPLRLSQVVVRNLLRIVDSLPAAYLVGGIAALVSAKAQRVGDVAAATIVVREPPPPAISLASLAPAKYNSLRGQQHVAARLRAGTSPALAYAAVRALLQRDELDAAARLELFAGLAAHFRSSAKLPVDVTDGIADEQFVRNVVEVLYRRPGSSPST